MFLNGFLYLHLTFCDILQIDYQLLFWFVLQFYEELVDGEHSTVKELSNRPQNKKITFADSDSSSADDDDDDAGNEEEVQGKKEGDVEKEDKKPKLDVCNSNNNASHNNETGEKSDPHKTDDLHVEAEDKAKDGKGEVDIPKTIEKTADEIPAVKQCPKTNVPSRDLSEKVEEKSIDKLIEAELGELRDKNKVIW